MDSFALAVSCGLRNVQNKKILALKIAIVFAIVQATTPIIGWIVGLQFRDFVVAFDHWFAVIVLGIIGGKMIYESYRDSRENAKDPSCEEDEKPLTFLIILWMGIATSIDALAVGVTFAFLEVSILLAVLLIGGCTLIFAYLGFYLGHSLGIVLKSKAGFLGGIVLIGLGVKILIEHLFFGG
ncbi:MAG: manganese efflux pump MntP [Promethearchaeota archaeon]